MFIDRNLLNQLNKDIFGGGIYQTKKLVPDYERVIMPDPSLPKIKRYNISSNNPLGYLMTGNIQPVNQPPMQSQIQESIPVQEIVEQPQQDLYSQKENQDEVEQEEQKEEIVQEEVVPPPQVQEEGTKKYVINDLGENNVLLPPGYSTDDENEYKLINLLNESRNNYELAVEEDNIKVYKKKDDSGVQLLKVYGSIPYPISRIKPVLMDTPGMDKWDKVYKKHEVIQKYPVENGMEREIVYQYLKMPVFMTDREVVQEAKTWSEYNGNPSNFLKLMKSTTNSKYPVQEKPIRAEVILGGIYLKEISPQETSIIMINNLDLKMTTGKDLADKKAPESAKDFVLNLTKYIGKN